MAGGSLPEISTILHCKNYVNQLIKSMKSIEKSEKKRLTVGAKCDIMSEKIRGDKNREKYFSSEGYGTEEIIKG